MMALALLVSLFFFYSLVSQRLEKTNRHTSDRVYSGRNAYVSCIAVDPEV